MVRDSIDSALLGLATFYRDVMMVQFGSVDLLINEDLKREIESYSIISTTRLATNKITAISWARTRLQQNATPWLVCEALMCQLANE